ncbi:hypothetical protein [Flavobacterium difficile]|uniref:Uncharacterized protein n=1 Tax=Flavobacterium difficile TaxID=2709659 RepID=A0ABX0I235_9FLAO|nr:hypothetical protein [Flavobacterium difficile]NHM01236.1 hypothetical protein [Flavobacterium difficile]
MKKIKSFLTLFVLLSLTSYSQVNYEFYGALKLNGNDKTIITYRLVFTEQNGKISGYSVTDLDGVHETKNSISGTYDKSKKLFSFQEKEILYTKSKFDENSFCFVNFSGKVKLVENTSKLEGAFKGLFNNKTKCIDGTMTLIGSNKIYNLVNKVNKKIQKSKKIDAKTKKESNPIKLIDSLKINKLSKNQNLNVFWESNAVRLDIWDNGQEDGDIIHVYQNNKLLLSEYTVTNKKKTITIQLQGKNDVFKIVALNEGKIKPNTAKLELHDKSRSFELLATLNKDEEASITIIKKPAN